MDMNRGTYDCWIDLRGTMSIDESNTTPRQGQHHRRAVLDVGSNSVLLTVCELQLIDGKEQWVQIYEDTAVTALGEGTKSTGLLGERGMAASLLAMKRFFQQATTLNAQVVAAATMAARIATNAEEFKARAMEQETPVAILSGDEEAELGFQSVANDPRFSSDTRISIIDPGGHSTEVTTAVRQPDGTWHTLFKKSHSIGTLGLKSTSLTEEQIDGLALLRASSEIDGVIGWRTRPNEAGTCVVLGATGTNLISIREKLTHWQPEIVHGAWLDYEEVSKAVGWMSPMTDAERAAIPGMEPGREKTIHLGALILERFLFALGAEGCVVSVRGWRHAVLESDPWFQLVQSRS